MLKTRLGEHAGAIAGAGLGMVCRICWPAAPRAGRSTTTCSGRTRRRHASMIPRREASGDHSLICVRDAAFLRLRFARRPEGASSSRCW